MKVQCVKRSRNSNSRFIYKRLRNKNKNVKKRLQEMNMLKSLELQEAVVAAEEVEVVEVAMVTAMVTVTMITVHPVVGALDLLPQIHIVKSQSLKMMMKMPSIKHQRAPRKKHPSSRSKIWSKMRLIIPLSDHIAFR